MELAAGAHAITVNFFENGGGASCKVLWRGPDVGDSFVKMHVVQGGTSSSSSARSSASSQKAVWKGKFYKWPKAISKLSDCDVSGKKPTKVVESREVDYNDHSFAKLGFNDRFVAKWTGSVVVKKAGSYTFKTCSDDGSNLFVGSRRVVNNDGLHGTECKEGSMELAAGAHAITVNCLLYTSPSPRD